MGKRPATIDVNADLGEGVGGPGAARRVSELEAAVLASITTAHIACGFHAGGPTTMRVTLAAAAEAGVAVGAHPSYPDRQGFGRRPMDVAPSLVADDVLYQVGALEALATMEGTPVISVKPHGALYNRMAWDEECTREVTRGLLEYNRQLVLVLPAGSAAVAIARSEGAVVVPEAFCDRGYLPDGSLAPRGRKGALLLDPQAAAVQAISLARHGTVTALDGTELTLDARTLCVHGDTPGAPAIAAAVRFALEGAGFTLSAPPGSR